MQIERRPSRWPYVGGLVCLLIFCLTLPRFWQPTSESAALAETDAAVAPPHRLWVPFSCESLSAFHGWRVAPIRLPGPSSSAERSPLGEVVAGAVLPEPLDPHRIDDLLVDLRLQDDGAEDAPFDALLAPQPMIPKWSPPEMEFVAWHEAGETTDRWFTPADEPPAEQVVAAAKRLATFTVERLPSYAAQWFPAIAQAMRLLSAPRAAEPEPVVSESRAAAPVLVIDPDDRMATLPIDAAPPEQAEPPAAGRQSLSANGNPWCRPEVLIEQLEGLAEYPLSARWADQTLRMLHAVTTQDRSQPELVEALLRRLSGSADEAVALADAAKSDRLRADLLRAHWGLARRIDTWAVMHDIRVAAASPARVATRGPLNSLFDGPPLPADVHAHLQTLSAELETYEGTRDPAVARQIAETRRALLDSPDELDRSLAGAIEQHYRNANIRLSVSAELINRFAAEEQSELDRVRDCIVGTPVYGKSHTLSRSQVTLTPATGRWQMELKADGNVAADTVADGGLAQLFNEADTEFWVRKAIIVAPEGVRTGPSSASAHNRNRVVDVMTDVDWVPLVGSIARNMAMEQYRQRRPQAKFEVEHRVASQAMERLDRETRARIDRTERDLRERFLDPLDEAGIVLSTIEMTSARDHVVGRFRLAGEHQLAGHTPRPRALPDSLASVQIHESALTNAAVALRLDGRRYTAQQLEESLRDRFPRLVLDDAVEPPEDTIFHFAPQDAVRLQIADGRLRLSLAFQELVQEGQRVRNFIAHAVYAPVVDGLQIDLMREGPLGFEGRIAAADRALLHNVFLEVLPEDRPLPLIRQEDIEDRRLQGLEVTQLVLEDGWIGLAIGHAAPDHADERSQAQR